MKIKEIGPRHHVSTPRDRDPDLRVSLEQHPHLRAVIAGIKAKAYVARQGGAK